MQIVLITTSLNAVRKTIQSFSKVELHVIDCADYNHGTFAELKKRVLSELEKYYSEKGAPDILLTYRCPCLIPNTLYSQAKIGAYNIHPSMLPRYPGINPWKEMFTNNETSGGVSIHHLSPHADQGLILMQQTFKFSHPLSIDTARRQADLIAARMVKTLVANLRDCSFK